ncbi:MAG: ribosome-associated protein [Bermanella sp.]|jgi:ribosome-associated protein
MTDEQHDKDQQIDDRPPSKSERKRQMHARQVLGEELANMSNADLAEMPVPADLLEAITIARRIKSREALRRQYQYIGKLMRKLETSELENAIERRRQHDHSLTRSFHELEAWRDRLVAEGMPAIDEFKAEIPAADRQKLRQLSSNARKENDKGQPPRSSRLLFRYLRELKDQDLRTDW